MTEVMFLSFPVPTVDRRRHNLGFQNNLFTFSPIALWSKALMRQFQPDTAHTFDLEIQGIASIRKFGFYNAARHNKHVPLQQPALSVEQIGQPGNSFEGMAHGIPHPAFTGGLVVKLQSGRGNFPDQGDASPSPGFPRPRRNSSNCRQPK